MKIETQNGYIQNLKNPTPDEIKFEVIGEQAGDILILNLRQLTMLRENLNDLIDYLQESDETDNDN